VKIEFGGSSRANKGFTCCDVRDVENVTYVCNCWEIDKYVDAGTVETIYSRHMFEHLTFAQGKETLRVWLNILKNGGKIHLIMPDLKYHVDEYIAFYNNRKKQHSVISFAHAIKGFYGGQREHAKSTYLTSFDTLWDVHKSGYDERSLKELLESSGYINFQRQKNQPWHLDIVCFKG
jgi:predicted SAM-dependent methyltransferase